MRSFVLAIGALFLCLPAALAQNAERISVTDLNAATPATCTVTKCPLPDLPAGPADGRSIGQMPGFPVTVGFNSYFSPFRGIAFVDMTDDGNLDLWLANGENKVYAYDTFGAAIPNFPRSVTNYAQYVPAVGDMNGDGYDEIVQLTRGATSNGRFYIFDHTGTPLPGFPIAAGTQNFLVAPVLYDLDGDGQLEALLGTRAYPIGYLRVFEMDGTEWTANGWPVALDYQPAATPAIADLDGDGNIEIVCVSYNMVHVLALDGTEKPGWPLTIENAHYSYGSPALADLDHDGNLEIIFSTEGDVSGCHVYNLDGTIYPGWPKLFDAWSFCPPTVTDLEGDGELEILCGYSGGIDSPHPAFWVWDKNGNDKPGFPFMVDEGGSEGPITVADVNGDGFMEIFADYNIKEAGDGNGWLFGFDYQGNALPGFPLRPWGWTYLRGASIADVNHDGHYELACVTQHDAGIDINLYTLPDTYAATTRDWKVYHARQTRGGWYKSCAGDVNTDGLVDLSDLARLLSNYGAMSGANYGQGDLDRDGDVDLTDLAALLTVYGSNCD